MRRVAFFVGVVLVTACAGEREEDVPASAAATPAPADTTRADSAAPRGDSMMARDTARPK